MLMFLCEVREGVWFWSFGVGLGLVFWGCGKLGRGMDV